MVLFSTAQQSSKESFRGALITARLNQDVDQLRQKGEKAGPRDRTFRAAFQRIVARSPQVYGSRMAGLELPPYGCILFLSGNLKRKSWFTADASPEATPTERLSVTNSLFSPEFQSILETAKHPGSKDPTPFPSPADWRDQVIYFLMVDRFNNKSSPPSHLPFNDSTFSEFQGGKFSGVQAQLSYIKDLGAGAIWLSPVLKNLLFEPHTYHGYGIHNFLHADPRFADNPANADDELRQLVDAAHKAGLYVILDIVLNHTGDAFVYVCDAGETSCSNSGGAQADFRNFARSILWRDATGAALFPDIATIASPPVDALVWPVELHKNDYFRRQGTGAGTIADFASLKQFRTDLDDVQRFLIRAYQYVIARYDIDGFRIDTLRYLLNDLPRLFGNSMREFALSIGKKNFFTYGEVFVGDAEQEIARFIGRPRSKHAGGVDLSRWSGVGQDRRIFHGHVFSGRLQAEVVNVEAQGIGEKSGVAMQ